MAAKAKALTVKMHIDGVHQTLAAFRRLPKEASDSLRDHTLDLSKDLARKVAAAARVDSRQSAAVAPTVKALRDRVPAIVAGGMTRVGTPRVPAYAVIFGSEFGAGLGVMILDINVGAIIYARTPDRIRARAAGAFRFINYGVRPVGALFGGLLGGAIGVREAILVTTVAAIGGVLFLLGSPVLRLRDLPEVSAD